MNRVLCWLRLILSRGNGPIMFNMHDLILYTLYTRGFLPAPREYTIITARNHFELVKNFRYAGLNFPQPKAIDLASLVKFNCSADKSFCSFDAPLFVPLEPIGTLVYDVYFQMFTGFLDENVFNTNQ